MHKPIYLYLTPCFPSSESWRGGFCYDAVKAIMRDGRFDVRVMTSSPGEDYEYNGIKVYRFKKFAIGCSDYLPFLTEPLKIYYFAKKLKEMGLSAKDIAVCHVHLFEDYAPYATWLKRKNPKCITLLHHHWTGNHKLSQGKFDPIPGVKELLYLYQRKHLEAADAQVCCSKKTAAAFGRWFPKGPLGESVDMKEQLRFPRFFRSVKPKCIHVEYNGIDGNAFYPRTDARPEEFAVGCVGNFTATKSQITLIKAFERIAAQVPNMRLKFVGSGAELAACEAYAREKGLTGKITFLKEMDHSLIPAFYRSLNLFVLPSYWEAFNCSFIEALGCGVPIIGTKGISIDEVLTKEDQDKWLVPPRDVDTLAAKLKLAYETRPKAQTLTIDLDIDSVARRLLNWIDEKRRAL